MSNRATNSPDFQSALETKPGAPETPPAAMADGGRQPDGSERPGGHSRFWESGELQVLPRPVSRRLRLPTYVGVFDVRFFHQKKHYLGQAALAALVMMILLVMVDSVADAVLAVGLASSAVVIFMRPNSRSAALRPLLGGHAIGLAVGMAISVLIYHPDWLLLDYSVSHWVVDIMAASALGIVILLMSITDTEHPPAAATAVGFAWEGLELTVVGLFIAGVLVLVASKVALRGFLRDLD